MKNWSTILLIFILPIAIYAYAKGTAGENVLTGEKKFPPYKTAGILEYSSPMCGECQKVKKIIEEVKKDYPDVVVKEVIVSGAEGSKRENKFYIKDHNVTVVPTLVFFNKNGELVRKLENEISKDEIIEYFNRISKGE